MAMTGSFVVEVRCWFSARRWYPYALDLVYLCCYMLICIRFIVCTLSFGRRRLAQEERNSNKLVSHSNLSCNVAEFSATIRPPFLPSYRLPWHLTIPSYQHRRITCHPSAATATSSHYFIHPRSGSGPGYPVWRPGAAGCRLLQ